MSSRLRLVSAPATRGSAVPPHITNSVQTSILQKKNSKHVFAQVQIIDVLNVGLLFQSELENVSEWDLPGSPLQVCSSRTRTLDTWRSRVLGRRVKILKRWNIFPRNWELFYSSLKFVVSEMTRQHNRARASSVSPPSHTGYISTSQSDIGWMLIGLLGWKEATTGAGGWRMIRTGGKDRSSSSPGVLTS